MRPSYIGPTQKPIAPRPPSRESTVLTRPLAHLLAVVLLLSACGGDATPDSAEQAGPPAIATSAQDEFWAALQGLCGQAFSGRLLESNPPDPSLEGMELVMHVRECDATTVRVPFHVGEDRSRTWVISRTDDGMRLKHDHRHEDGTEDEVTQYGGDTATPGSRSRQVFAADEHTASIVPESASNLWTLEIRAGRSFVYALRREGSNRRVRFEFDLTRPIDEPPAPWGS